MLRATRSWKTVLKTVVPAVWAGALVIELMLAGMLAYVTW